jgi:hypothetical protein
MLPLSPEERDKVERAILTMKRVGWGRNLAVLALDIDLCAHAMKYVDPVHVLNFVLAHGQRGDVLKVLSEVLRDSCLCSIPFGRILTEVLCSGDMDMLEMVLDRHRDCVYDNDCMISNSTPIEMCSRALTSGVRMNGKVWSVAGTREDWSKLYLLFYKHKGMVGDPDIGNYDEIRVDACQFLLKIVGKASVEVAQLVKSERWDIISAAQGLLAYPTSCEDRMTVLDLCLGSNIDTFGMLGFALNAADVIYLHGVAHHTAVDEVVQAYASDVMPQRSSHTLSIEMLHSYLSACSCDDMKFLERALLRFNNVDIAGQVATCLRQCAPDCSLHLDLTLKSEKSIRSPQVIEHLLGNDRRV